jgi:hypothetical protein
VPIRKATAPAPTGDEYAPEESLWEDENPDEQAAESSSLQEGGWAALQSAMEERKAQGGSGNTFRFTSEARPVLFLSDGPVSIYNRHWVNRKEEKARRSFKCIASKGVTCPLCALGNKVSLRAEFQVLDLEFKEDEITEHPRIMNLGITAAEQLEVINKDERKGPLQGHWFAVYMTGNAPKVTHHFEYIKERDLEEDWNIPLAGAKQFAEEYVGKVEYKNYEPDLTELQEVAAEIKKA